jgi:hypothetical protein
MTAAQKKNVERFKKAAAEAKKLRKKNPKLTQAQAVKQAFAILYKTGKVSGVKKPATKKKAVKIKIGVKKKATKKASPKSYHKDTKSHNVRISVVSGIDQHLNNLAKEIKELNKYERNLIQYKSLLKNDPKNERIKYYVLHYKRIINSIKKDIQKIKRHIK